MRIQVLAIALVCSVGAWAWQDSLAQLKLNRETFERLITGYVNETANRGHVALPPFGGAVKDALLAMNDSGRATIVKELGLAAKSFVMSPAFQASYDAYIKNAYNAVNHGITVTSNSNQIDAALKKGDFAAMEKVTQNLLRDSYRQGVIQRLPSLATYDKSTIEMMAEADTGMVDISNPETAAEKAAVAKSKAMLGEAKKLAATDIAKARETYKAALMTAAGLKDEAEAQSSAASDKRNEEQQRYNDMLLKPLLKKRLLEFVSVAKTVDFQAATTLKDKKHVFVNPAYERRSELWKLLYRLGPGGSNTAAQVASQWAAEL
jgi:hypothetical protein